MSKEDEERIKRLEEMMEKAIKLSNQRREREKGY